MIFKLSLTNSDNSITEIEKEFTSKDIKVLSSAILPAEDKAAEFLYVVRYETGITMPNYYYKMADNNVLLCDTGISIETNLDKDVKEETKDLDPKAILNAVKGLFTFTGKNSNDIKFILDVAEVNGPEFLVNSKASIYRRKLALNTWLDRDEAIDLDDKAKEFYEAQIESALNDGSIDDDIVEEIYKCLNVGFNLRLFLYKHNEFLTDINKIKQITYAAENQVSLAELLDEKGDSVTMEELLKFRLDKQYEVYLEEKKLAEDEDSESEITDEQG